MAAGLLPELGTPAVPAHPLTCGTGVVRRCREGNASVGQRGSGKGPLHERAVLQAAELGCDAGESREPPDTSQGTLALPGRVSPALWENR